MPTRVLGTTPSLDELRALRKAPELAPPYDSKQEREGLSPSTMFWGCPRSPWP